MPRGEWQRRGGTWLCVVLLSPPGHKAGHKAQGTNTKPGLQLGRVGVGVPVPSPLDRSSGQALGTRAAPPAFPGVPLQGSAGLDTCSTARARGSWPASRAAAACPALGRQGCARRSPSHTGPSCSPGPLTASRMVDVALCVHRWDVLATLIPSSNVVTATPLLPSKGAGQLTGSLQLPLQ